MNINSHLPITLLYSHKKLVFGVINTVYLLQILRKRLIETINKYLFTMILHLGTPYNGRHCRI